MSILRQIGAARAPLVAFAAMGMLWGTYAGLIPDIKAALGVSDAHFGSLLLATPIAAVTAMLMAPKLAPRFGRNVLPMSVLALGLAFALPGWMAMPLFFALSMMVVGIVNGFLDVTMTARVSAIEVDEGLHLMNLIHAAYSFGYAGAAAATGLARGQGFGPGPILTAVAVSVAVLAVLTTERGAGINGFARAVGVRGKMGMVPVWGGIIVLIAFMSENAAENWSALHIERTLGAAKGAGSFGPAVLALTMGVGRMLGQIIVARVSQTLLMRWAAIIGAGGMVMVGLAPTPMVAYVGLVVTGLGGSVIAPTAFSAIGRLSDPHRRMLAITRATAMGYLGYFFGPAALGLMSEVLGLRAALVVMAGMILLVLWLFPKLLAVGGGAAGNRSGGQA